MTSDRVPNFFELFGLPVGFDVDVGDLSLRYRDLQRRVHPDRHASATAEERRLAMQFTTLVNEAHQTLKEPVRRGRYLLALEGLVTDGETDTAMAPAFLMEQMELREALEEVRHHEKPAARLADLAGEVGRRMQDKIGEFRNFYVQGPTARPQAKNAVREMQFLEKLQKEIGSLEEEFS
jgi:molecular chaperone HscB